ncbi:selenium metabolism-associated LysR family transcriptional regulator [Clostridium rectalis]|uniref:selenium metabolism-associated LysR family transcriptional regulator n=1 Tax=Clostridium rectalis TaxID=2040295 RepID=UPI000F62F439|nr:selenium metabolism-associated LysR family transcriptional regulator [Clostridium rectalis]
MNDRKLKVFYEVATKLNMTEVSQKLYISQPAVSQTIQELERELNLKLFDRIGRKLFLTHEGDIFLGYVRRILNIYDEAVDTLRDNNSLENGKMKIGASTTIGIYILPEVIGKFIKNYKNIDVSIAIENTKIISDMIVNNEIDFALVEGPIYEQDIKINSFCEDELVIITSMDHLWTKNPMIDIHEIGKEKIIMRENGSGTREVFENILITNNVKYNMAFQLGNTEAIKKAVEAGLGISCISYRCVKDEVKLGKINVVKIKDINIKREFSLIYHRDKYLSKLITTFIDFAKKEIDK